MVKNLAIYATTFAILLVASSLTGNISAITIQEMQTELGDFNAAVNNLTADDFKKSRHVDKFIEGLHEKIDKISNKLEKEKLNSALRMMKGLVHLLERKLTNTAMNDLKSTMPITMAAIG